MDYKEQLNSLREEIDEIDSKLVPLFLKRMDVAKRVAQVKCENNLPVLNAAREQQVAEAAAAKAPGELKGETALLMRTLMSLSREYQHRLLFDSNIPLLPDAAPPKTHGIHCAFQGVPGAWSEQAAMQFFPKAQRQAMPYFEDVFKAVKNNEADYGIVPIENSKTGAIGETYDLLKKYGCFIVRRVTIPIRQCLLTLPDVTINDIQEVISHPEGLKQCRKFLESKNWQENTARNTAVAAKSIADEQKCHTAAIGSPLAAQLYGLKVLEWDIMDDKSNSTAFVVIAKQPEYNNESNRLSLTFSTAHRSGALCEALLPFMAENLNMMRIESRPTTAGQYRFFVDIEGNILNKETRFALRQAAGASDYFEVLGCYSDL